MPCILDDIIVTNVLESMPLGLMVIRPDGKISLVNDALIRILGRSREDMLERGWGEIFYDDHDNDEFNQILIDVIVHKPLKNCREAPYASPGGAVAHLSITSSYLRDGQGALAGIVVLIEDVTEKYLLHQSEKQMLQEKNRLEKERVNSLKLFAMSVAHQIRNPLMSIGGFSHLLMKGANAKQLEYLNVIIDQSTRMETIVRTVSDFTSIPKPVCRRESFESIWKTCRDVLDRQAGESDRNIVWRCDLKALEVYCDAALLRQVLEAGLRNVLDFNRSRVLTIGVFTVISGARFCLEIQDDGPGISPENIPYVFDPFFTTKANGVGMGLTLARRIIDEHRGEIHVSCPSPNGTRFAVELPLSG